VSIDDDWVVVGFVPMENRPWFDPTRSNDRIEQTIQHAMGCLGHSFEA
jgi:hypothetical protein